MDIIADQTDRILMRLRQVPDTMRNFQVSPADAHRIYGISGVLLAHLVELGLPAQGDGGEARFDVFDLMNVSLHLKLGSIQRMAMRSWGATLRLIDRGEPLVAHIQVVPDRLGSPRDQPIPFSVLVPGEGRITVSALPGIPIRRVEWGLRTHWPDFPPATRTLLERISSLDFFMLPEALRWNLPFIERTGMSECGGASKLLLQIAGEAGLQARQWFGLLLTKPFATGHFWTEIEVNGDWVPFDPLLLKILGHATGLERALWPADRSPGAAFVPLALVLGYEPELGRPILDHTVQRPDLRNPMGLCGDEEIPVSLPTEIVAVAG